MIRSFKYRLHPNKKQEQKLNEWLLHFGQLFNAALEHRIGAYKKAKVTVTLYDQYKQLTELREMVPEWGAVSVRAQRSVLKRLNNTFNAFFRRCKNGEIPGFPRFKPSKNYKSFSIDVVVPKKNRIRIPNLGHVKFTLYRPIEGAIKNVSIQKDRTKKWWVSFSCDVGASPERLAPKTAVGIDLGLTTLIMLSTGTKIHNPRFFRKSQAKLKRQQQAIARKKRDSKTYHKHKIILAKTHAKIKNQRITYAKEIVCYLFNNFDLVAYEDLNIKSLASGMFAKSVSDAGWGIIIAALILKAENAGKWAVAIDPRNTTQACSNCDHIVPKEIRDRQHICPNCNLSLNRDHNAALNVLKRAWPMPGGNPEVSTRDKSPFSCAV